MNKCKFLKKCVLKRTNVYKEKPYCIIVEDCVKLLKNRISLLHILPCRKKDTKFFILIFCKDVVFDFLNNLRPIVILRNAPSEIMINLRCHHEKGK